MDRTLVQRLFVEVQEIEPVSADLGPAAAAFTRANDLIRIASASLAIDAEPLDFVRVLLRWRSPDDTFEP